MQPASTAIDQVAYLASLASQPAELDVILDPFRDVTSRIDRQQPLSPQDAAVLQSVKQNLETYLTTRETVRYFTPESLELQLEQHFAADGTNGNRRRLLFVISFSCALAIALAVGLPLKDSQQRGLVGGATLFAFIHLGSAWFFLTALGSFSAALRKAFRNIAYGVTILGLSLVEKPIQEIFRLGRYAITSVIFAAPIVVCAWFFYIGVLQYARVIGVRGRWVSFVPLVAFAVPLSVITWFLPSLHASIHGTPFITYLASVLWIWTAVSPIAALVYLPRVVKVLPELYKPPIRAFYQALWAILAVTWSQYIILVTAGPFYDTGVVNYAAFGLAVIMGSMLLRAGYMFNKNSRY